MSVSLKQRLTDYYNAYSHHFVPSWLVLVIDIGIIFVAYYISLSIRLNFDLIDLNLVRETPQAIIVTSFYLFSFLWFQSYTGIIRHTGLHDAYRIFQASAIAFLFLFAGNISIRLLGIQVPWTASYAALIIHLMLSYFLLMGFRISVKTAFASISRTEITQRQSVIIYGAGTSGLMTRRALLADPFVHYKVLAFADDNQNKAGKMLEGVPVMLSTEVLSEAFHRKHPADMLIIASQTMNKKTRAESIEKAIELGMQVKEVPPIENWINGQLSSRQLRQVRFEQLLERESIRLDNANVQREVEGSIVMVTGAAGSIGSEMVRQLLQYKPERVVLVDQAESALFDLMFEINHDAKLKPFSQLATPVIADVNDLSRLESIFHKYVPQLVYHAAAYKHVPLMEDNPFEAVKVNVLGTRNVANLALAAGVRKFVMVSTDKAINPTNIMGASKRIAEIYIQSLSNQTSQFITTRFGNVLGSNGSVIPIFQKQIEQGGPVTITHREIIRYFMTIPEACSLVLEAGAMGQGAEIFVFDMGQPVTIYELARKMIKLSGFEPGKDIKIVETGLRPGEKLYEELLSNEENTLPTHHPKILRAKTISFNKQEIERGIAELADLSSGNDAFALVGKMKEILPEFISNNSIYSVLDKTN